MLYLPEMRVLNEKRVDAQKPVLQPVLYNDLIIVIHTPGKKKCYFDPSGNFVNDRNTVRGWRSDDLTSAKLRAEQLQKIMHLDTKVAVDQR